MSPRTPRHDYFVNAGDAEACTYLQACLGAITRKFEGVPRVSTELGVSPSTVYRWLGGETVPQKHWLKQIYRLYEQHCVEDRAGAAAGGGGRRKRGPVRSNVRSVR